MATLAPPEPEKAIGGDVSPGSTTPDVRDGISSAAASTAVESTAAKEATTEPQATETEPAAEFKSSATPDGRDGISSAAESTAAKDAATEPQAAETEAAAEFKSSFRLIMAFATLSVLTMVVAVDGTSIGVALPIITQDLNGSALEAFWVGTSFLLTSAVFQPNIASFSSIFGRMPMLMLSIIFFLVGVLVAGLAHNFTALLVGRTIQGIGGGGLIVLTEVLICDLVPLRLRGQWFGVISGTYAIGTVAGPVIGGAFSQFVTWRWILWINLPFIGLGALMVPAFIRLQVLPDSLAKKVAQIDWFGSVLFIAAATGLIIPISWGGVQYSWSAYQTLVPLLLSAAGLVAFVVYEDRWAAHPLIPIIVFKNRNAAATYLGAIIHSAVITCLIYYLVFYYEAVKGFSPTISGVASFPETFTIAPAAVIVGILITVTGTYRWAIWGGWTLMILGTGLLMLLDVPTSTAGWIFLNIPVGIGAGMLYPSLSFVVQAATADEHIASAVAMYSFFRQVGQTLGVAIGGVVFQNQMRAKLLALPALAVHADEYSRDASALVQVLKAMAPSPDRDILVQAYSDALHPVWAVMCGLSGAGLLISLFVRQLSLDRLLTSKQQLIVKKKADEAGKAEEGIQT